MPGETEMLDGLILIVNEGGAGLGAGADPPPPQPGRNSNPVRMRILAGDGGVRMLPPPMVAI